MTGRACRFDLVSINPVMMLGPVVSAYGSSNSIMEMKLALEGNEFKTLSNKARSLLDLLPELDRALHKQPRRFCAAALCDPCMSCTLG